MVQDLIGSSFICALTGYALSLVVSAFLSQSIRGISILEVAFGLLLAAGPIYLGVDYVVDQGAVSVAVATGSLAFGLYCMRGWWVPERLFISLARRSQFWAATKAARLRRRQRLSDAYLALRHRMLNVVRGDRQLQLHSRNTSLADPV